MEGGFVLKMLWLLRNPQHCASLRSALDIGRFDNSLIPMCYPVWFEASSRHLNKSMILIPCEKCGGDLLENENLCGFESLTEV